MNVNTTSTSTSASSSNGLSGLMSGMDTDAMVDALLSGTQSKIDAQNALLKQTTWRQEMYRSIISDINSFKSKYFDILNDNSLLNASFFNSVKASSSSKALSVLASSSAIAGNTKFDIAQLATSSSISSNFAASGDITATLNSAAFNRKVSFNITDADGKNVSTIDVDLQGLTSDNDILNAVQTAFGDKAEVSMDNGKLSIKAADTTTVSVNSASGDVGLKMLGLTQSSAGSTVSGVVDAQAKATLDVTYDGIKKTISLDDSDLFGSLQKGLNSAFGKGAITLTENNGKVTFDLGTKGHTLSIYGETSALSSLGFSGAKTNTINLNTPLSSSSFATALQGNKFEFTINGVDFSFSGSDTMSGVMSKINSSSAGVKLSYDSVSDGFKLTSSSTGSGFDIEMSQKSGNLLTSMFGVEAGSSFSTGALVTKSISGTGSIADTDTFDEGVFKIVVNGREYDFSIPRRTTEPSEYTGKEVIDELNKQLLSTFGKGTNGEAALKLAGDGTLSVNANLQVSFNSDTANLNAALGLTNQNNTANANTNVSNIVGINTSVLSTAQQTGTLGNLLGNTATINADGSVTASAAFADNNVSTALFGSVLNFGTGVDNKTGYSKTEGTNAVVAINGVVTERTSNSFEINGMTVTLNSVTDTNLAVKYDAAGKVIGIDGLDTTTGSSTISATKDVDTIVDTIKNFVNDYNTLIGNLNAKIGEEKTYSKYPPLTDAQKKEMSESEIKLWEEKSKGGLLANDSTINSFLSDMRSILYTKPEGCNIALYDLGIETGSYTDKGKLVIDEAVLRSAVEKNSEEIGKLFTAKDGISNKLSTVIDATAKASSGSPGSLVSLAGTSSALKNSNTLTDKITSINEKITKLKASYESEKTRYWNQFNAMEEMLSNLNSQSSWITSMFGS